MLTFCIVTIKLISKPKKEAHSMDIVREGMIVKVHNPTKAFTCNFLYKGNRVEMNHNTILTNLGFNYTYAVVLNPETREVSHILLHLNGVISAPVGSGYILHGDEYLVTHVPNNPLPT